MNTHRIRIAIVSAVVALGLLAGCGGGGGTDQTSSSSSSSSSSDSTPTTESTDSTTVTVATSRASALDVFAGPTDTEVVRQLASLPDYPLVLLVLANGAERVQVALPTRPNGSSGWVRISDVELTQHSYRVEIDLSDHRLSAYDGDQEILETTVAVGTADTPTPTGRFYVTELVQPPNPDGAYGPFVFALSAHSEVLDQFGGGDGQVGIHGTNQPALLGSDVSHGCIRMANADIVRLTEFLPLGTPVEIRQ